MLSRAVARAVARTSTARKLTGLNVEITPIQLFEISFIKFLVIALLELLLITAVELLILVP
jgi:hypothetical protein